MLRIRGIAMPDAVLERILAQKTEVKAQKGGGCYHSLCGVSRSSSYEIRGLGKATGPLAGYVAAIEEGPVVVTKRGRPVAALIPIRQADLESVLLSVSPRFQAIIKRSRAEYKRKGGLSAEEMRERLAK